MKGALKYINAARPIFVNSPRIAFDEQPEGPTFESRSSSADRRTVPGGQSKSYANENIMSTFDRVDWNCFEEAQVIYPERRATADIVSIVALAAVLSSTMLGYAWLGQLVRSFFA